MNRAAAVVVLVFLSLLSLLSPTADAQKHSSSAKGSAAAAGKLIVLTVTGTARYTDKEILVASGLVIGQSAADGDFKEAVQHLGDTGMFNGVVYSYTSSDAGIKLDLQLTDADKSKLIPARFENLVWFTDDELLSALQRRVPLFKQQLPIKGNLPDRVSEALQAMLSEKQFPGRVNYLRIGEEADRAVTAIDYRVEEIDIRVRGIEFPGASPEQSALLTSAARRLKGAPYDRSAIAEVATLDLLPVYLRRGYLKAEFGPSNAHVTPTPAADAQTATALQTELQVDAIIPVTPGKIYSTSAVDWKGNSAVTNAELAPRLHLPAGKPADAVLLLRDIENIRKLYRSRGYMSVQIKPEAQFDDEKSTVHYDLSMVEGDLYRMGELEIVGLDKQARARVQAAWTLQEGQPYNADYPGKFVEDSRRLLPSGAQWDITVHETPDAKDKTVDVEIHFKQP